MIRVIIDQKGAQAVISVTQVNQLWRQLGLRFFNWVRHSTLRNIKTQSRADVIAKMDRFALNLHLKNKHLLRNSLLLRPQRRFMILSSFKATLKRYFTLISGLICRIKLCFLGG